MERQLRQFPLEELKGYKYRTGLSYSFHPRFPLAIRAKAKKYKGDYLSYDPDTDMCTINDGYGFDGPSGPMVDTLDTMFGALKHDALYQLMRLGVLPQSARKRADDIMYETFLECGMSSIRAGYAHFAVRKFAKYAAEAGTEKNRTFLVPMGE